MSDSNRSVNFVKPPYTNDSNDTSYDSDDESSPTRSNEIQTNPKNSNQNQSTSKRSFVKKNSRKRKRAQSQSNNSGEKASSSTDVIEPKKSRNENLDDDHNGADADTSTSPVDASSRRQESRRKKRKNYSHPQRNKSRFPIASATAANNDSSSGSVHPVKISINKDKRSSVSNDEDFEIVEEFNNLYASARLFEQPPNGLRPIAIDGCNVAWGHGNDQQFSYKGMVLCADFFRSRGHQVKVFVPRNHQPKIPRDITDELIRAEILVFTPSRNPGKKGKLITSYDDRFIVQYAVCTGGIIISNDNFNDLFDEQPTWRETITNRVLQHTWISRDILMFPLDPMGRKGKQTLDDFLRFPNAAPSGSSSSPVSVLPKSYSSINNSSPKERLDMREQQSSSSLTSAHVESKESLSLSTKNND